MEGDGATLIQIMTHAVREQTIYHRGKKFRKKVPAITQKILGHAEKKNVKGSLNCWVKNNITLKIVKKIVI